MPGEPEISVNVNDTRPWRGDKVVTVSINAPNATVDSKSASFMGNSLAFTGDSASFTISSYLADQQLGTLSVTASNAQGSDSLSMTISRDDSYVAPVGEFTWDNALVYFVMTDRFYNGNTSNDESYGRRKSYGSGTLDTGTFHGGDIAGLTHKLEDGYFTDLGVNAIWITAPYEQIHGYVGGGQGDFPHYGYHGYYALDYTSMDKNMGTVEEMRAFVDLAHEQGVRVILDIVLNHAGYENMLDASQYNYGQLVGDWQNFDGGSSNWHGYHDSHFPKDDAEAWGRFWGPSWVRKNLPGYDNGGGDDLTKPLSFLPDFKTELTHSVGISPLMQNKWGQESSGFDQWIIPGARSLRSDIGSPADSVIKWLAAWVEEFGIDGFRCDTAKHVELHRWQQLSNECNAALGRWRSANTGKPGADWDESFWMTGEVWGHGPNQSEYHNSGFDSIINFNFPKDGNLGSIGGTWADYAGSINSSSSWNALHYISSHDTALAAIGNKINAGTCLVLSPGGVQIFYGDENDRPLGPGCSDADQRTRSDYVWGANQSVLEHWQKLGKFRRMNPAVGAGNQIDLGNSTYGRTWNDNKVVIRINASGLTSVSVDSIFFDGTSVRNAYNGETATVSGGSVTFTAENNVILIEEVL
jgi:alpha-amylase